MIISVTSALDESSRRMRGAVFPLAIDSLKKARLCDPSYYDHIISKIKCREFFAHDENIVISMAFDPKSCGMPIEYCCAECGICVHNPLNGLLEPLQVDEQCQEPEYVITNRNTINSMLDVIALLANALKARFISS